jgi:restriction system protein
MKRNPESPWNPEIAAAVTPVEYEEQVVEWLRRSGPDLVSFDVTHLRHMEGAGGDYEIDAVAEMSLFGGARIVILVECKRHNRPVERDAVAALWAKLQDIGAHKAVMFATCGFQSGALTFAMAHGIATVAFVEGRFTYETRSLDQVVEPPPWAGIPRFCGLFLTETDSGICSATIDNERLDELQIWLRSMPHST